MGSWMDLISAVVERDRLRQEFPGWCIFHDPYATRWFAVHGRREQRVASTPQELRWRLLGGNVSTQDGLAEPQPEAAVSEVRQLLDMMSHRG